MMLSFLYKNLLKNTATSCLKSPPQLCLLNQRYFFGSEIRERRRESIFSLFKNYGFSETQISTLIKKSPVLLSSHPDKILKPKLDFFNSYGFTASDLDKILRDTGIMHRSLDNHIIPSCEFLRSVLRDNGAVIAAIKRSTWILKLDLRKTLEPNIVVLRNCGVSDGRICTMLRAQPWTLIQPPDRFILLVEEIKGMGFEPVKSHFAVGLQLLASLTKSTFKRKWDLYRKWGWSDDEILSAFRRQPQCMSLSEEKVERVMVFLVNRMGWDASKVASCPIVVMHSLEKWTIPRCLVVQFLMSKGVIEKDLTLSSFIVKSEKRFLEKFVVKYCAEIPEVLNLYGRIADDIQKLQVERQTIYPYLAIQRF